ncbi:orotidine-5'-phosphate decarboxylase [Candidatus Planktophila versatilis]|uniref:Orotidine 5'-phosphate decarboxylase n=1 Tax=Candidatus Planktophila versatilis TaxID=1884905 RepID=A0AAC9YVE1_9ACTN|nr:orotidine-5'-phosphate decarboxylase [Candidatus Planktophila versatilis]ASY22607.1 orotidine-5'-phosphate decarboxylase [Candidatus Planktophila versatilis]
MKAPIVLAVDTQDLDTAQRWIEATQDHVSVYKLGLEFFLTFGHEGVRRIKGVTDSDIFLDLKLHDIPHTVGAAATAVQSLKPRFLTVHASGGRAVISAAVQALPTTDVTAVTILTSLSEEDLFEIGFANNALESAVALAKMSTEAGARAIVCSPLEIAAIRSAVGDEPQIITPGVRPEGSSRGDDQKRTMTPRAAIAAGASYVVIGRPITQAWAQGAQAMTTAARTIAEDILQ